MYAYHIHVSQCIMKGMFPKESFDGFEKFAVTPKHRHTHTGVTGPFTVDRIFVLGKRIAKW